MAELPQKPARFLDILADQQARIDELSERNEDRHARRMAELLNDVEARDPELWESAGADDQILETTQSDYDAVPADERDLEWRNDRSIMLASAHIQAWAELVLDDVLDYAEIDGEEQVIEADALSNAELRQAAHAGVSKTRVSNAKERRQKRARTA